MLKEEKLIFISLCHDWKVGFVKIQKISRINKNLTEKKIFTEKNLTENKI